METFLQRAKATVFGHAIGDALGVPAEFLTRDALTRNPVTDMRGYGTHGMPAGTWSDDTSMTLCALDGMENKTVDFEKIMKNFAAWLKDGAFTAHGQTFDVGATCSRAVSRYLSGVPLDRCGMTGEYDNGNGSLMRIHPFVLFAARNHLPDEEMLRLVRRGSALTHAHPRAVLGCEIYALVLSALLREPARRSIASGLKKAEALFASDPERGPYAPALSPSLSKTRETEIRSDGYFADTLQAALWCLLTTRSYPECVLKAVNLGDDSDTTGAVAGGLAGALYSFQALPERWKNALAGYDRIDALCEKAFG